MRIPPLRHWIGGRSRVDRLRKIANNSLNGKGLACRRQRLSSTKKMTAVFRFLNGLIRCRKGRSTSAWFELRDSGNWGMNSEGPKPTYYEMASMSFECDFNT